MTVAKKRPPARKPHMKIICWWGFIVDFASICDEVAHLLNVNLVRIVAILWLYGEDVAGHVSVALVLPNTSLKQFPKKTKGYLFSFLLSANPAYIISMSNSFLNGKLALIHTATQTSLG